MKGLQLIIKGNWGHFKKPETNNNPLSYDFITKPALIGLIGAVLGIDRNEMRPLFPILSEDFLYGVQILNPIKKISIAFTLRKAVKLFETAPKHMEFLKSPKFLIAIALRNDNNDESKKLFDEFVSAIKNSEAKFTPVLGMHNCPANLEFISEGNFSGKLTNIETGFKVKCVITSEHKLLLEENNGFCIRPSRIPTFQNDDFWNPPDKYIDVIYPSEGNEITVKGNYYKYLNKGEFWWLI